MDKPAEILLFDSLTEKITSADPEDLVYALELHDTVYQKITTSRGLRISDVVGDFSPGPEMVEKEIWTHLRQRGFTFERPLNFVRNKSGAIVQMDALFTRVAARGAGADALPC